MFNETYLSQERFKQRDGVLAFARASLHFVCYFTLTRLNLSYFVPVFDKALFACTLLAATGFVLFILAKKWNEESRADLLNELLLPAITAWSLATKSLTVDHLVLYHFIFWALHPIPRLKKQSKLLSYLGWTSILSGVAALFTPLGPHWGNITVAGMSYLIGLASFFHFFSSFALSRSHPEWIKRWFFPKAATVVAIASPKTFSKSA